MKFCKVCESVLTKVIDGNSLKMTCKCGQKYDGDPIDQLIASSSKIFQSKDVEVGMSSQEKYADYDRVNLIKNVNCPQCNHPYMYLVLTNMMSIYKCEKCHTITNPRNV